MLGPRTEVPTASDRSGRDLEVCRVCAFVTLRVRSSGLQKGLFFKQNRRALFPWPHLICMIQVPCSNLDQRASLSRSSFLEAAETVKNGSSQNHGLLYRDFAHRSTLNASPNIVYNGAERSIRVPASNHSVRDKWHRKFLTIESSGRRADAPTASCSRVHGNFASRRR